MFWRKKKETKTIETEIGVLSFNPEYGYCEYSSKDDLDMLYIWFSVNAVEPDQDQINRFVSIFKNIETFLKRGLTFALDSEDYKFYRSENCGELSFEGISLEEGDTFQLIYGFTNWPDGSLKVEFCDGIPSRLWVDD